uniref:Secretory peptide n=1 Tax=Heteropoda venatoria TaxID=152925 RepID=A0A088BPJ3_HETVE|nr:secretory peptide [Heteropoda venatoria]
MRKIILLFLCLVVVNCAEEYRRRGDIDPEIDYDPDDFTVYEPDLCLTEPGCRYNCDNGIPCECVCKT